MKYNIAQTFVDLEGKEIVDEASKKEGEAQPSTLGRFLTIACLNADGRKYPDGVSKYKIYKLIQALNGKETEVEFSAEDVTLLKDMVGTVFSAYIVGKVYDVLEQKPPEVPPPAAPPADAPTGAGAPT